CPCLVCVVCSISLVLCLFSLYGQREHRALPSFPTRRSSDLAAGRKTKEVAGTTGEAITDGWITTKIKADFINEDTLKGSDINVEDRKSTRLNSSHEWISYAVFCLKKKKKRQNQT